MTSSEPIRKRNTTLCRHFNTPKGCLAGDNCSFVHEIKSTTRNKASMEGPNAGSPHRRKPGNKRCRFGSRCHDDNCTFVHPPKSNQADGPSRFESSASTRKAQPRKARQEAVGGKKPKTKQCKYGSSCRDPTCEFVHPTDHSVVEQPETDSQLERRRPASPRKKNSAPKADSTMEGADGKASKAKKCKYGSSCQTKQCKYYHPPNEQGVDTPENPVAASLNQPEKKKVGPDENYLEYLAQGFLEAINSASREELNDAPLAAELLSSLSGGATSREGSPSLSLSSSGPTGNETQNLEIAARELLKKLNSNADASMSTFPGFDQKQPTQSALHRQQAAAAMTHAPPNAEHASMDMSLQRHLGQDLLHQLDFVDGNSEPANKAQQNGVVDGKRKTKGQHVEARESREAEKRRAEMEATQALETKAKRIQEEKRLEQERRERAKRAAELERERLERERLEKERREAELAKERLEKERREKERYEAGLERERLEREAREDLLRKQEAIRKKKQEEERAKVKHEQLEKARAQRKRQEEERKKNELEEQERIKAEKEKERIEADKTMEEAENARKQAAADEKAKLARMRDEVRRQQAAAKERKKQEKSKKNQRRLKELELQCQKREQIWADEIAKEKDYIGLMVDLCVAEFVRKNKGTTIGQASKLTMNDVKSNKDAIDQLRDCCRVAYRNLFRDKTRTRIVVAGLDKDLNGRTGTVQFWDDDKGSYSVGLDTKKGNVDYRFLKPGNLDAQSNTRTTKSKRSDRHAIEVTALHLNLSLTFELTSSVIEEIRGTPSVEEALQSLMDKHDSTERQQRLAEEEEKRREEEDRKRRAEHRARENAAWEERKKEMERDREEFEQFRKEIKRERKRQENNSGSFHDFYAPNQQRGCNCRRCQFQARFQTSFFEDFFFTFGEEDFFYEEGDDEFDDYFNQRFDEREEAKKREENQKQAEALGVAVDASPQEIKSVYRSQARQLHPDKYRESTANGLTKDEATERFKLVQNAYDHLMSNFD